MQWRAPGRVRKTLWHGPRCYLFGKFDENVVGRQTDLEVAVLVERARPVGCLDRDRELLRRQIRNGAGCAGEPERLRDPPSDEHYAQAVAKRRRAGATGVAAALRVTEPDEMRF